MSPKPDLDRLFMADVAAVVAAVAQFVAYAEAKVASGAPLTAAERLELAAVAKGIERLQADVSAVLATVSPADAIRQAWPPQTGVA